MLIRVLCKILNRLNHTQELFVNKVLGVANKFLRVVNKVLLFVRLQTAYQDNENDCEQKHSKGKPSIFSNFLFVSAIDDAIFQQCLDFPWSHLNKHISIYFVFNVVNIIINLRRFLKYYSISNNYSKGSNHNKKPTNMDEWT